MKVSRNKIIEKTFNFDNWKINNLKKMMCKILMNNLLFISYFSYIYYFIKKRQNNMILSCK